MIKLVILCMIGKLIFYFNNLLYLNLLNIFIINLNDQENGIEIINFGFSKPNKSILLFI